MIPPSHDQQQEIVFNPKSTDCPYAQIVSEIVTTGGNLMHRFPQSFDLSIAVILRNHRDYQNLLDELVPALDEMGAQYEFDAGRRSLFLGRRIWIRFLYVSERNCHHRLCGVQLDACVFFPFLHIPLELKHRLQVAEASMRLTRMRCASPRECCGAAT